MQDTIGHDFYAEEMGGVAQHVMPDGSVMAGELCWLYDPVLGPQIYAVNWEIAIDYFILPILVSVMMYSFWNRMDTTWKIYSFSFIFFILSCGIGHAIKADNMINLNFQLEYYIDFVTAKISSLTVLFTLVGMIGILKREREKKLKEQFEQDMVDSISSDTYDFAKLDDIRKLELDKVYTVKYQKSFFYGVATGNVCHFRAVLYPGEYFGGQYHDGWEMIIPVKGIVHCATKDYETNKVLWIEPFEKHTVGSPDRFTIIDAYLSENKQDLIDYIK